MDFDENVYLACKIDRLIYTRTIILRLTEDQNATRYIRFIITMLFLASMVYEMHISLH